MRSTDRAKNIIEQIAESDENISPILPGDYSLFKRFFDKEEHSYGNSWVYVTQGMYGVGESGLGYKYFDGKNLCAVNLFPKIENPDVNVFYWKRPMGEGILNIINDFSHKLLKERKIATYVKKLFVEQYDFLIDKGFSDAEVFPWHSSCASEDDTLPEVIIDVKATINNKENKESIKRAFRRFSDLDKKVKVRRVKTKKDLKIAWEVAQNFFKQDISSLQHNISNCYDYYNPIFSANIPGHELFLATIQGKSCGVFDLYELDKEYYASYMSLMLREEVPNLNEFSVIYRCKEILNRGGKFYNLGGSESETLHKFKTKFAVKKQNKMHWAALF